MSAIISWNSEKSNCRVKKNRFYVQKFYNYHKYIKISMSDLMGKWLGNVGNNLKLSTLEKYKCIVRNHIVPILGNIQIKDISSENIQMFINGLLDNGLARSTINDIIVVLNMGLTFAEKEYDILCPKAEFLKIQKKEMRILSAGEQIRFVKHLIDKNDIFGFGMLLALFTGMRIGELCALKWEDVSEQTIKINKTMQRINKKILILPPKTESSVRTIPIPCYISETVEKNRKESGYVLQRENAEFTEPRLLQLKFKKYTEECEINNVHFHVLRHTFSTKCVESGLDIKTLSEILGHSDVKITLNKYVHSTMEQKIRNMEKIRYEI